MVLVSYKPIYSISILQTKLSHRERHKARRIGLEAMPLDQHIEGGHGECQAGLKVLPAPVHDFLEVADHRGDVSQVLIPSQRDCPNSYRLMKSPITRSC